MKGQKNRQIEFYENKLNYEMDPSDLYHALQKNVENIMIMDARQPEAYKREHIPGAINLPHAAMTKQNCKPLSQTKTYICYCDGIGCNASTKAALNMSRLGFKVKELIGGLEWWKLDGYATEGDNPFKGTNICCDC